MSKKFNQYIGKAGHLAVMSEFLMRGWNVAIPEVDKGDDIFVVQDNNGILRRVQVKTSTSTRRQVTFTAQFNVSVKSLRNVTNIFVHYVFIVRHNEEWAKPVIIRQDILIDLFDNYKVGSEHEGNITLYFSYSNSMIECSGHDFTKYIRDFSDFPFISH